MVHVLQVDCLAYWHAACSTGGLLSLLAWYMVYWWTAWPTGMVNGLLVVAWRSGVVCGLLEGALPTGIGLLVCCVAHWQVMWPSGSMHDLLVGA